MSSISMRTVFITIMPMLLPAQILVLVTSLSGSLQAVILTTTPHKLLQNYSLTSDSSPGGLEWS
jgi:hypothetical protein